MAKKVEAGLAITSWDEADAFLGEVLKLESEVTRSDAEMNEVVAQVRALYVEGDAQGQLRAVRVALGRAVEGAGTPTGSKQRATRAKLIAKGLEAFAEAHKDEIGEAKSRKLNSGVIGFRMGTGVLDTVKRMTWAKVLLVLKAAKAWREKYVRVKEEVNKEALLADLRAGKLKAAHAAKIGVCVDKRDTFFYEAKSDKTVAGAA